MNKYNKLLWIKLNGTGIWELQKKIDESLREILPIEERFMSHITIARIKKVVDTKLFLEYIKNLKHRQVKFKVKEFILKKSELKPEGPVYTDLQQYLLE